MNNHNAALVLADGTIFRGKALGHIPPNGLVSGEIISNTSMSGYLEAITDPASTGQLINFTYPQIGNVGASPAAEMSDRGGAEGVVVRELVRRYSHWQATQSLEDALKQRQAMALSGVDTRRLTRHLRGTALLGAAFGVASHTELLDAAQAVDSHEAALVAQVTTTSTRTFGDASQPRIVVLDLGVRASTISRLSKIGSVTVVSATTSVEEIEELRPQGLVVSSGPGNPALLNHQFELVGAYLERVPILAIGLGAMVLAHALGASTHRLVNGHYGSNVPVRRLSDNRVEITSQNRSYGITAASIDEALVTHQNLNDGEIEGVRSASGLALGVTYNPDLGPGIFDSAYLLNNFASMVNSTSATARKGH